MEVTKQVIEPEGVTIVTLVNNHGAKVKLSSLGAGIVLVSVPDRRGRKADVLLGYQNPLDYLNDGPCAGKTPGRYANRIAGGHLEIDGKLHQLAINNGPNALHGGPTGFQNRVWQVDEIDAEKGRVVFSRTSPAGEENYPGTLKATVSYTWNHADELTIDYTATTDAPTVVNLTNHAYWNLSAENSGPVLDHELQLPLSSRWLPTDDTLIPSGEMAPVEGTPMDFRAPKALGRDIKADFPALNYGKGYDNCWVIDDWKPDGTLLTVARLHDPKSGRTLEVDSTQPGVQVYTGNWLEGSPLSKSGRGYHDYEGVAIECQGLPDAPNKPAFPSQRLDPGQTYRQTIRFRFIAE